MAKWEHRAVLVQFQTEAGWVANGPDGSLLAGLDGITTAYGEVGWELVSAVATYYRGGPIEPKPMNMQKAEELRLFFKRQRS